VFGGQASRHPKSSLFGHFAPAFFLGSEEVDSCLRIKAVCYPIWYWLDIVIIRKGAKSSRQIKTLEMSSTHAQLDFPARPADRRIGKVLEAIESNPSASIQELSRLVNLSSSRLSHLFKAAVGLNLNTFLSNRRLERAADLLQSTEMQIKEITYCAGYSQAPSFVRAFERRFGSSPTNYRRQRFVLRNSRSD
jgi:AraC-like DNA-binding protein